jgi:hypothetical protein
VSAAPHLRSWLAALALGALLSGLVPAAAAGEWVEEVPPEPGAVMLPHLVFDAVTADLDGDGQRELVRLVPGVAIGGAMAVDVWKHSAEGWSAVGEPRPVHREARVGEFAPKRIFTLQSELAPVLPREPSRLLVVRDGLRERVLVVATGEPRTERACCLTVWQVQPSGALTLLPIVGTARTAVTLLALDLTGDGRDELLATTPPDASLTTQPGLQIAAYRLEDGQLHAMDRADLPISENVVPTAVAGGSGLPGEVAIVTDARDRPTLHRISLDENRLLRHETAPIPFAGQVGEAVLDGHRALVVSGDEEMVGLLWPPGADAELIGRVRVGGDLLPVLGDGAEMLIPVVHRPPYVLHLLASDLRAHASVTQTEPVARLLGTPVAPYVGPLPGEDLAGGQAIVFRGRLLHGEASSDGAAPNGIAVDAVGSFAAAQPVGYLGDGDWMAILHTLGPWFDLRPEGGELAVTRTFQDARLAIVPAAAALSAEASGGRLRPPISEGVPLAERGGRHQVLTRRDGFVITLGAPPGSRVLPVVGDPPLPADARLILVPPSGEMTLRIQPPAATPARSRYVARLVVVTPAGRAYTAAWQVEIRDGPPDLEAQAAGAPLSFRVPVSGQTEPGVAVWIDGEPVAVADDGSFSGRVRAGPWPRTVRLEAVDPLGNRAVETLSVVGPVDYRRLPWVPIVAGLTLAAAVVIYLRAPRPRVSRAADGGSLEELDDNDLGPDAG